MRHLLLASAAFCMAAPAMAGQTANEPTSADRFRATVEFLADDLLEGREAGTRGYDLAAHYVATEMKGLGLMPGDVDGDFMQDIKFANYLIDKDKPMALIIGGERIKHGDGVAVGKVPAFAGSKAAPAEAVYVGSGISAPEFGIDALGNIDLKGKVAVKFGGMDKATAEKLPSDVRATLMSTANQTLLDRGAVGVITIVPDEVLKQYPFEMIQGQSFTPSLVSLNPDGSPVTSTGNMRISGVVTEAAAAKLFAKATTPWSAVKASKDPVKAFALGTTVGMERTINPGDGFTSANVVGMIPGSDPKLKNEVIALVGHLDHVGIRDGDSHGSGQKPSKDKEADAKDRIYNGAMDNATGIASLLEAARMFKESGKAPRRTIMFIALTAEEKGLMGAEWLAGNMQMFGGKKLVGLVNLDMPVIVSDFDRVVAYGSEHSTMGSAVEKAISDIGVTRIDDPMPEEVFFIRSDHFEFVKAGIPSLYIDPYPVAAEEAKMKDFLDNHYHQASDEVDLIDWDAGAKFAKVNYEIARMIADADAAPAWYADSYFGNRFAPKAAKAKR